MHDISLTKDTNFCHCNFIKSVCTKVNSVLAVFVQKTITGCIKLTTK